MPPALAAISQTPYELSAELFELRLKRLADDLLAGIDTSRFLGSGTDYAQSRRYQPGDTARDIDWRVTARTGRWHVREYEALRRAPVYIVLDTSGSMAAASVEPSKHAAGVWIAGALAFASLRAMRPVSVVGAGDRVARAAPGLAQGRVRGWLNELKEPGPHESTRVPERLAEIALFAPSRSTIVLISDLHAPGIPDAVNILPPAQLAPALPGPEWLAAIDPGLAQRILPHAADIHARADRFDDAFALILAAPAPAPDSAQHAHAHAAADHFLAGWSHLRSPSRRNQGAYYDPYGGGYASGNVYYGPYNAQQVTAIPLTRAKQTRNLAELRDLLPRLRDAAPGYAGHGQAASAFAAAHSSAEVFRRDDMEVVFGALDQAPPEVTRALAQSMRLSLASHWRNAREQRNAGTNRKKPEISAAVVAGYELAAELASLALAKQPGDWRAIADAADIAFDRSEYLYGQKAELAVYAAFRDEAFRGYRAAAQQHVELVAQGLEAPEALAYYKWFSAALGASDLGTLTRVDSPDDSQIQRIAEALASVPDPHRPAFTEQLALSLASGIDRLNPELKPRYVAKASSLVGDHPAASDLRELGRYYEDLVREVRLALLVDGPSDVGTQPFGVRVALETTKAVTRESGGFAKYLAEEYYDWQTGRTINHRGDIERAINNALADRFEVLSLVFHEPGQQPYPAQAPGLEHHPLAYLVLRVTDAAVDRLPRVKIDLDFADGKGRVILPVVSDETLISASAPPATRPVESLKIEQILDARQLDQGALSVEIQATASGVLPDLDALLDLSAITDNGFRILQKTDHGLNVSAITSDAGPTVPTAERSWVLELAPAPNAKDFAFPPPLLAGELTHKRFDDADIVDVQPVVSLSTSPSGPPLWLYPSALAAALAAAAGLWFALRRRAHAAIGPAPAVEYPAQLTPMSAYLLLRRLEPLAADARRPALRDDLRAIEQAFFAPAPRPNAPAHSQPIPASELELKARTWYTETTGHAPAPAPSA